MLALTNLILPFVFILARLLPMALLFPAVAGRTIPARLRLALVIVISVMITPLYMFSVSNLGGNAWALAICLARELVFGLGLALSVLILVAGMQQVGSLVSQMAGQSAADVDPGTSFGATPVERFFGVLSIAIFLSIGGHRQVVDAVLQKFNRAYPRMKIQLVSSYTLKLQQMYQRGECDLILTTEDACGPEGETLLEVPLVWVGAPGGTVWTRRPLRLALEYGCFFRRLVQQTLDAEGIPWEMGVEADSSRTIEASVSADLAICTMLEGTEPGHLEVVSHNGELPVFSPTKINLYANRLATDPVSQDLVETLRVAYQAL